MAYPRPKILTRVTVPTGGWAWDIDISNAAQYDTNLTGTVAAGDYFVSGDNQSDDLLHALQDSIQTEIDGSAVTGDVCIAIDPDTHKVVWQFFGSGFVDATGDNDVRLNLSSFAENLCAALGHDTSDVASTATDNPTFTADWHHAYGWYADEDGQLGELQAEDNSLAWIVQSTSLSGKTKSQYYGERFTNTLRLEQLERDMEGRTKVHSQGIGYGAAPVHPYNRNEPLECWWEEARQGIEFRFYEDGRIDTSRAGNTGASSACNTTTLTDASKSWTVEPFRWKGRVIYIAAYSPAVHQCFYIASHTATVLTVANAHPSGDDVDGGTGGAAGGIYFLFDHPYQTYVVDLENMTEFAPQPVGRALDRYSISIPLKRFV